MTIAENTPRIGQWGRAWKSTSLTSVSSFLIMALSPLMVFYFYVAVTNYKGSLFDKIPAPTTEAFAIWGTWLLLQILFWNIPDVLHKVLPGYSGGVKLGAISPQGKALPYKINGLQAWTLSQITFLIASYFLSPTFIFDNWGPMLVIANIAGNLLALFVYIKARLFPSDPKERKFSGSFFYDYYMGIEFNPRIGDFDFKLFFNGRPGICAWTLINFSFAFAQYNLWGEVTNSMILVLLLQGIYIIHFFWYEAWYLKTIDICHDHFGWMLAWGDLVWLPWMYTLQAYYLVYNPVHLSVPFALFVLFLGLFGYAIFFFANTQKDLFKKTNGNCIIWGKPAQCIEATYMAEDGKPRQSRLLVSGAWGLARHLNYTGDLILSLAFCLATGFESALPYFYFCFMTILLVHRSFRDEHKMRHKYGLAWNEYAKKVPARLIPGLF